MKIAKGFSRKSLEEIIDFAQFLRQKEDAKSSDNITSEPSTLSYSQDAHVEEEFKDYKQRYSRPL